MWTDAAGAAPIDGPQAGNGPAFDDVVDLGPAIDAPGGSFASNFRNADENGDGVLSASELRKMMEVYGDELTEDGAKALLREDMDLNHDGTVDYDEASEILSSWVD